MTSRRILHTYRYGSGLALQARRGSRGINKPFNSTVHFLQRFSSWISTIKSCREELIIIIIIPLFTLGSIYSTNASGAEQMTQTNNSNCWFVCDVTTAMLVVCWWSEQKHFSPLGTKPYFHVKSSRKNSVLLPPTWPPCHVVASQDWT